MIKCLVLSLSLLATSAFGDTYEVEPKYRGGGNILKFWLMVGNLSNEGTGVVIGKGGCTSACTLFLLAEKVCVHPDTVFEFHGPTGMKAKPFLLFGLQPPNNGLTTQEHKNTVDFLANAYNLRWPGLGDWFLKKASGKYGYAVSKVKGIALHTSFNVPLCH
tara:strand:+ start:2647 stop:3129 length:483 start_codon:yes stop_codon:yes gene_type:complete